MKKSIAICGIAGAVWMILLLSTGSFRLAWLTDYPGIVSAGWVQYRGIAPPTSLIWATDVWMVLTSALEWIVVGLALRTVARRFSK